MTNEEKQDADRLYNNLHISPYWNGFLNKNQVNYLLQERGDLVYCNGHCRQMLVDAITSDSYKVYTKPFN